MYDQIAFNRRRTFLLFFFFLIVIIGLGYAFSYIYNDISILFIAVVFSVGMSWLSYYHSDKIVLSVSGAKKIEKSDAPELYRTVENLCITAGLPLPKIYIISDQAMNAFATGRDEKHSAIAVTSGLLQRLNKTELEGVISHELSHIKNKDILLQTVVVTLVGLVAIASRWLFWGGMRRRDSGSGSGILAILGVVLIILAPIAVKLIQLSISRKREYLADASGALLTRYPKGLADALRKISGDPNRLRTANQATAHLFISNPLKPKTSGVAELLMTHPPVEKRIKKLSEMIPGDNTN